MSEEGHYDKIYSAAIIGTSLVIAYIAAKYKNILITNPLYSLKIPKFRDPLKHIKVKQALTEEDCKEICQILGEHCVEQKVLGFDCEWVTRDGKPQPIALLQLASGKGMCGLFRLCNIKKIPEVLKVILEDKEILKVGVSPFEDSKYLHRDYGVKVNGCLDLRYLHPNGSGGSLASLAEEFVNIKLNKHWRIRCSDWESEVLSDEQIDYAAKDALVAVEIYKKFVSVPFMVKWFFWGKRDKHTNNILSKIQRYKDIRFYGKSSKNTGYEKDLFKQHVRDKPERRGFSTRKTPLYHNCFMHAPDGELLCSCDQRKAEWYVERGLAEVIPGEPFSIRLFFEPAGRASRTNEGRFYTQLKGNHCVVCGAEDSYLRHNVVPRDYRKHFPSIMKDHQSHDIVLMCLSCHKVAGDHDEQLRRYLAELCDAPIQSKKMVELNDLKKVQKAAKAILTAGHQIPIERMLELEKVIKDYYETEQMTAENLQDANNLETKVTNECYVSHGIKVVNYFIKSPGGLLELEKLWREHFLNNMKPQFLPYLWSVNHNHERLAVRAAENRVNLKDLEVAGLPQELVTLTKNQLEKERNLGSDTS